MLGGAECRSCCGSAAIASSSIRAGTGIWEGIVWPDVEADFSIRALLLGHKSGESPECFKFWLDNRRRGRKVTVEQWLRMKHDQRQQAMASRRSKRATVKKVK